jgi:hypothetical protein
MFRALTRRLSPRWQVVSFRGRRGAEWRGIVDVIAIRKATGDPGHPVLRRGDLFEIVIVQLKGGSARDPSEEDIRRLRAVRRRLGAKAIVLYSWKRRVASSYRVLDERTGTWKETRADAIFG